MAETAEELSLTRLGGQPSADEIEEVKKIKASHPNVGITNKPVDTGSFTAKDWSTEGKVASVKNQGTCGACWAFSSLDALQSASLIQRGVSVDLSEQQLVDCYGVGCGGAWMTDAMDYASYNGLTTEVSYPYTSGDASVVGNCKFQGGSFKLKSYKTILAQPTAEVIRQMQAYGPLAVGIYAPTELFSYGSGPFKCLNNGLGINHAVVIVGNDKYGNLRVKNSWGEGWGDKGYFWITNDTSTNCLITDWTYVPLELA
jgi:cathepsin L